MRPARVWAIARRDLAAETKGRRGIAVPVLFGALLLPIAAIPVGNESSLATPQPRVYADGDVPPAVLAMPKEHLTLGPGPSAVTFSRDAEGRVHAAGLYLPPNLREVLDGDDVNAVITSYTFPDIYIPRRSFLIALLTASILVGAVSETLPGERSRKTLETLLTAGITRLELISGKAFAWGGLGALATLLSALVAVALDRMDLGLWILPMPLVPLATVSLGLYFVRRSADVVGGSTVTVRIVPAVLGGLGLLAWGVGVGDPVLGALVPLGGALIASGDTWPGVLPPLVATASTGAFTAGLLWLTARDLESDPIGRENLPGPWRAAALFAAAAGLAHFASVLGPLFWGLAGNMRFTAELPLGPGVLASSLLMLLIAAVAAARETDSAQALNVKLPVPLDLGVAALGAVGVLATTLISGRFAPTGPLAADALARIDGALIPTGLGLAVLAITAQELVFRGAIQRLAGPMVAAVASAFVLCPLDPVRGLVLGALLSGVVHATGSVGASIAARLVAVVVLWALGTGA